MLSVYNRKDKIVKIVIMSLVSVDSSKKKIAELFNYLKRQVDESKKIKSQKV